MGVDSAWYIADAWKQTKKIISKPLRRLRLDGNQIGDKGATAILEALETNYTLHVLLLFDQEISKSLEYKIEEEMSEENREKRRLQLEHSTPC